MERKRTILLVEDEAPARAALQELLEARGYLVLPASGGVEALVRLRDDAPPDLIISDLVMGLMSGWELSERQQVDYRLAEIPVILVSGVPDLPFHAEALNAAACFSKPVDLEELVTAIETALHREPVAA